MFHPSGSAAAPHAALARDEDRIAGELASTGEDVGPDVRELHEALLRAGLVEDTTGRFDYLSEELPQGDRAD
jgi:hypothetical protein